ncbi:T9SS type A sorting domain-containing protein [Flavicella sediminum]|uniref:T9SS type A sorting domain-containing protein n=1 Tax=Flavicella sediminum TaxID=2585141 RepID=UPI001123C274|nr:T9SS type A sorting domain-containing protein [Flavicella sediminum]
MRHFLLIATFSFSCFVYSQNTYVPDDNFEQALIDLGYDSGPLDNNVPTANINTVSTLDLQDKNIQDLTGIESFVSLTKLDIALNRLTSINLSNNTSLTFLSVCCNQLTSLDLSNNLMLEYLHADENKIENGLDFSEHPNFRNLDIRNNPIASLNVKNGNNINFDDWGFFTEGTGLNCIEVDNPEWSYENWTLIDSGTSFSVECSLTLIPDDNFEQALIDLGYDSGPLDNHVLKSSIKNLKNLNITNKNISDLTGIEEFVALEKLECQNNLISSLDISNNPSLTYLNCSSNLLNIIDLSSNTLIKYLDCSLNQLEILNLNSNLQLNYLDCSSNILHSLNVRNTNNTNFTFFSALNNINLECIIVDNSVWSNNNWFNIDMQSSFDLNCIEESKLVYVPDDAFEYFLETHKASAYYSIHNYYHQKTDLGSPDSMGNGIVGDNYVLKSRIATVTDLYLTNDGYSDLTGIEHFEELTNLEAGWNNLTTIDLSKNRNLNRAILTMNYLSCIQVADINSIPSSFFIYDQRDSITPFYSENCINLSNEKFNTNIISVYPNPVKNKLSINIKEGIELKSIIITDITGKIINTISTKEIDFSNHAHGIYFLYITTSKGSFTKKIIKN